MRHYFAFCLSILFIVGIIPQSNLLHAQELESRLLTNIPLKYNVLAVGYGYASGNMLLDPAVPIEDFNARLNSFVGAYVRSIKVYGMSGKFDVVVPFRHCMAPSLRTSRMYICLSASFSSTERPVGLAKPLC
jgi:hypothetical protein